MEAIERLSRGRRAALLMGPLLFAAILSVDAAHRDVILVDDPVAYFPLEELLGETTAKDASPGGFDGEFVYDASNAGPVPGVPGIGTNAVSFLGGTEPGFIRIPFRPELNPVAADGVSGGPFSAECWAQPLSHAGSGTYRVALAMFGPFGSGIYGNASGWNFYQHSPDGSGSYWILNMRPPVFLQAVSVPIVLLEWHHLAVTFDGTTVTFYINGEARGTSAAPGYLANNVADGQIGAGQNTGQAPFEGSVDEVAFYGHVLTAGQILAHYQSGTNSFRAEATAPGITQQPSPLTVFSGTTATFQVTATGTPPLTFQWRRNGAPVLGATNSSYTFLAVHPADAEARFSVVVSNPAGAVTSAEAALTVETGLEILRNPYSIIRRVGSHASFRVVADGARPIEYRWFEDGNLIPGETNDTLWLRAIPLSRDEAAYGVELRNPFTTVTSEAAILSVEPRLVEVSVNGYARLVMADAPVAYWRLDEPDSSNTATDAAGSFDGAYVPGNGTFEFRIPGGIPGDSNPSVGVSAGSVISIPHALELNPVSGPWSAEAWVRPDSLDPAQFRTVFSSMWNSDFGNHVFGWNVYQHVAGVWTLNLFNGGGSSTFVSDFTHNPIVPGSWYHMVITDDRETIRFHVNGSQVGSVPQAISRFAPNGLNGDPEVAGGATVFGQRSDNAFDPGDGALDDVAIYNTALTPEQILVHYQNAVRLGFQRSGAGVTLTWPFGTLEQGLEVGGPYSPVSDATSPFSVGADGAARFFRLRTE